MLDESLLDVLLRQEVDQFGHKGFEGLFNLLSSVLPSLFLLVFRESLEGYGALFVLVEDLKEPFDDHGQ